MKMLVIGGTGLTGSTLVNVLNERGHAPIASDDVALAMAEATLGAPVNDIAEVAGPERVRPAEVAQR
ncbi:hypothetical protein [Pandoraea sp. XY-2]|uniref:hypothetical protein n=1 Tax=Pandoraea sp. XY-2 TaxID=2518599 RepID=UPI001F0F78F4|nr:hypothetical protein [Pandoraea sp. XY-2]